ncbi:MAG TPA: UDP-N-acetylglucosamine 2-epimerase (non-hydrolyzing) [Vicinamibacterales bacterium]|nr:UDP-N-acetylglucosamine 2-epimerase (non-hydrolyzing) [Vicinamibacterales bacterium]
MKIVSIAGARPQFMKVAPVAAALIAAGHHHTLVHTGQHYDDNMSAIFFRELGIPAADIDLGIGSAPHGAQTGAMLTAIESGLLDSRPDWLIVYGDTNSTLAGALAAAKLQIRVAHVEAGLRSFNRRMPEEINRVVADHVSDALFCPSDAAVAHLRAEGVTRGVHMVGDVMADALTSLASRATEHSAILRRLGVSPRTYVLATVHRAENTDDPARLAEIVGGINHLAEPVVLPIHPRTRKLLADTKLAFGDRVRVIDPVGYLDMLQLTQNARLVLTDSGGLQKEAYWLGVPCVTMRDETEWVETVDAGWNVLVGASRDALARAVAEWRAPADRPVLYGDGRASARIVSVLEGAE